MKNKFKILYLKDPNQVDEQENSLLKGKYNLRVVSGWEKLQPALKGFVPHVLLCSLKAPISAQEVLDLLSLDEEDNPLVLMVAGGNLQNVLHLIEAARIHHFEGKRTELEERHSSAYFNSVDGILVTKPDGAIVAANPAACEMLEMTEEEIRQTGRAGIVDPEDPGFKYAIDQREKYGHVQTELTFVKKGGEKFPVDLSSSVFEDTNGKLITIIIIRDITKRKLEEEKLRISNESYRNLFYNSPIPYWIYDQDSLEILDVNEMALKNYGYTREEFLNLTVKDLRPKEELSNLQEYLKKNLGKRGAVRHGKFTHIKKDGTLIEVEVYGYRLNYSNRNCRLVASIDITDKEKAARMLELKKSRLAAAQEMAKIGYWELEVTTQTFFFSDMMYKIWGIGKTDFKFTWSSFENIIHPEDKEKFLQAQENSIQRGKEHDVEYRIIKPTGEIRWIRERGQVLARKNGVPRKVERTAQDITEEKVYLEQLTTSESRYRGIVQSQTNYLIRTDMEGNYTYYNEKFFSDFGWIYENEEILGRSSLSSIKEYHHQAVKKVVETCVANPGKAFQIEIDKPKKEGGVRTTLWDFVCLLDHQGRPKEIQCVGIDISARVKAEKELKNNKLRYQLITEATSDAIWDWDLTTGKLSWGRSFLTMFGHDPKDMQGLDAWLKLVHPDDRSRIERQLKEAIEGAGKKWQCEYRLKKKSGKYAYVVEKGTFLRNKNLRAHRLVGALQDITEKKKLENLLENANSLSRIGSFELDLEKEELYWSPMTREIHEVGENFVPNLEKAIKFYKKGTSRKRIEEAVRRTIEKNEPYDEELEIVTASGKELWVKIIAQPQIENGKCIRITGSFQDIDKIKRTELKLKYAAKERETLLESIGDAFFAVNEDWIVTYWNKQAAKLLDCPKEEILEKNVWDIFPDAVGTPFQDNYEATMKDRQERRFEAFFDRTSNWFEVMVYPSDVGLSIFFKDVTERKTAEVRLKELNENLKSYTAELVTANKGLEQFTYIVSHNLRSPVANILGLADLLQNEDYPSEVKENLYKEVFSNIERLDTVIRDLNSILQVKIGVKAKREEMDLKELIKEISSSIQNIIGDEKAEIICDFRETKTITSVRGYLHSIFYNLILNSIKYKRPGIPPVLKISAVTEKENIIFYFEDNGMGIDLSGKEDQLFQLYKRFHHHVEGKGMGLFMVKTQVEMLGGKISIDTEVGRGTVFTIEIPNEKDK